MPEESETEALERNQEKGRRQGAFRQLRRIGISTLVPVEVWKRDRPWNLDLVRWFMFFTLFPLFMISWASLADPELRDVAFIFGIYFATIWGVVIYFFIRPERISVVDLVRVSFFTAFAGLFFVTLVSRLPGVSSIYATTQSATLAGRVVGYVFGVGLVEELAKALPILWIFVRNREPGSAQEITFLGCVSGFAFGVSEAMAYSVGYAENVGRGSFGFEDYIVVQFTRLITLPLLHAMFSGIVASFIALGVANPGSRRGLMLLGFAIGAVLHGLYNTFAASPGGFIIAFAAVLLFILYVRSAQAMQEAIRGVHEPDFPDES
ncbi:MAG: PrsW family intramembrane metalloprotease [bacterium]|nr:PrsW family intramembrane metalloprotease [bacterium]